jgi:hypothetical protein
MSTENWYKLTSIDTDGKVRGPIVGSGEEWLTKQINCCTDYDSELYVETVDKPSD